MGSSTWIELDKLYNMHLLPAEIFGKECECMSLFMVECTGGDVKLLDLVIH